MGDSFDNEANILQLVRNDDNPANILVVAPAPAIGMVINGRDKGISNYNIAEHSLL